MAAALGHIQPSLFGGGPSSFDPSFAALRHVDLGQGAWIDLVPGWVSGEQTLFDELAECVRWKASRRPMYDRVVDVPRLTGSVDLDVAPPVVRDVAEVVSERYAEPMSQITAALYRDGGDSVAPHGDQVAREMDATVMATVSLGARRRFLLAPAGGGRSMGLSLGGGDLLIMGGTIQRTWRHSVPKGASTVGPRMCVMFRPPWLG